jgi:biopolymer transport protein ExbB
MLSTTGMKPSKFLRSAILFVLPAMILGGFAAPLLAADNPAPGNPGASAPAQHAVSWGEQIRHGGNTALIQFALSIFGGSFIFERLFNLRRKNLVPVGLSDRARGLWRAGKYDELEKLGTTDPSTLARIISFITKNRHSPMLEVSEICGDIVSREMNAQYQRAYPLGIVATLQPLLGLLGMILGMIGTFETVALAGSLGDATQLAAGISEALVTTGLGLAFAIPFLAFYHFFKFRTNGFGAMLEEEVTNLLSEWLMKTEVK